MAHLMQFEEFEALCEYIEAQLGGVKCDTTLKHARQWLADNRFNVAAHIERLETLGAIVTVRS